MKTTISKRKVRILHGLAKFYGSILGLALAGLYMYNDMNANLADIAAVLFILSLSVALLTSTLTDENDI